MGGLSSSTSGAPRLRPVELINPTCEERVMPSDAPRRASLRGTVQPTVSSSTTHPALPLAHELDFCRVVFPHPSLLTRRSVTPDAHLGCSAPKMFMGMFLAAASAVASNTVVVGMGFGGDIASAISSRLTTPWHVVRAANATDSEIASAVAFVRPSAVPRASAKNIILVFIILAMLRVLLLSSSSSGRSRPARALR